MKSQEIDWIGLKVRNELEWRKKLRDETLEILTSSDKFDLSILNEFGCFHYVPVKEHFEQMKRKWKRLGRVPPEWIAKGTFPGIWTALFDPKNTYYSRIGNGIARFYFKDGYYIYDGENTNHVKLLNNWENGDKLNSWEEIKNEAGLSLKIRLEKGEALMCSNLPSHKRFYEDHGFGAAIGYSDYVSTVILLEDCVEAVEFFEI